MLSPCCGADTFIQDVKDFKEQRDYKAKTCWECNQIIEEVGEEDGCE
jgi:hypothetical protein